jgi:acyl dehydratase/NAD(P)-dependent dehydrogenase (short-subunit alcohol dehydrogenase family)
VNAQFEVQITSKHALAFAEISGDWNPLHTDEDYAARTPYRSTVLHGAFSAGLVSRMAGMYLPGKDCLLHGMRLRFMAAIVPPATLLVTGTQVRHSSTGGTVDVSVSEKSSGRVYVQASYEYGRHEADVKTSGELSEESVRPIASSSDEPILVTGASGALGGALLRRLGDRAIAVPRGPDGSKISGVLEGLVGKLGSRKIGGIVHCAWPRPDNVRLTEIAEPEQAIAYHLGEPLAAGIRLAQVLKRHGSPGAAIVLVGSTAASPGRHGYRSPLYSIAKSTIPVMAKVLALELAAQRMRCVGALFDVLDGGMNGGLSAAARIAHSDRSPIGEIATMDAAAHQIAFVLANQSMLLSGGIVDFSGGAIP